jgi:hypothetical protein
VTLWDGRVHMETRKKEGAPMALCQCRERERERERGMGGRLARGGETWEGGPGTTRWRNGRGGPGTIGGWCTPDSGLAMAGTGRGGGLSGSPRL